MAIIGFHASHELYPPSQLLAFAQQAEAAGFQAGMCSDHFHPWTTRQGESGFTWSWLGAALERTGLSFGTVCAPGQRYHPAVIAQAAATLAEMYPDRFWLAIGTGQALNEAITGEPWPQKHYRRARLMECAFIMRNLWAGEEVTHHGRVVVERAKLYTRPERPPLLIGAAITEDTAEWVGNWADGLVTVGKEPEDLRKNIQAFRAGGGVGKPIFLQAALSYAPTEIEAQRAAYENWPACGLDVNELEDTATPEDFDQLLHRVKTQDVVEKLRVSSDLEQHLAWLQADLDLGFDAIYLHHVGPDMRRFIDVFGERILPRLRRNGDCQKTKLARERSSR
jgi:probable non-F420 flavinoid oxidoreductase